MSKSPIMNMFKGAMVGMIAGVCLGYAGKNAADENPKLRRKISRAQRTMENVADTARYMFK